jgi:hypothetical protein
MRSRAPNGIDGQTEPVRDARGARQFVRARVPCDQIGERVGNRLDERAGEAARDSGAKGIAKPRCILGCGHPGLPSDPDSDRAVLGQECREQRLRVNPGARSWSARNLAWPLSRRRSQSSATACRSASGASPSYMYAAIQPNSSDCAKGDGRGVSTKTARIVRVCRPRRTSRSAGWSKKGRRRRGGILGQRKAAQHQVLDLVGVDDQLVDADVVDRLGETQDDAVVASEDVDVESEPLRAAGFDRERPWRVETCAERREEAHAPVADLVGEALDDDPPVVGEHTGSPALVVEVGEQVGGGAFVEVVDRPQARQRVVDRTVCEVAGGCSLTQWPSGRKTLKRPRSGTVPPLIGPW